VITNESLSVFIDEAKVGHSSETIGEGKTGEVNVSGLWKFSLGRHNLKITNGATFANALIEIEEKLTKVHTASPYDASQAEDYCAQSGMHLYIPHTRESLSSAWELANSGDDPSPEYLHILGIYPKTAGATCPNTAMTSETCTTWRAGDDGTFWVSERTDIPEPNGDNCVTGSMGYWWNPDGTINRYNDISCPGYTSDRFICQKLGMKRLV